MQDDPVQVASDHGPDRPTVPDLAARLAAVIEERGLVPGDRFLTTDQAARLLRVRRDFANRALQVLVHRGQIERAQRIGARVIEPRQPPATFDRVHVVVQVNHPRAQTWSTEAFQVGLHAALPGCEVRLQVGSPGGEESFLEPLLRRALRRRQTEGLVLVRCDYPTQRLAAECGLPAVLHGTPYAGLELPYVDVDGRQMGQLQAEALVPRGCDRLVVIRRDRSLPGDRLFMVGFREAAADLGFDGGAIEELHLAPFSEVVAAELAIVFRQDAKLGIVCATRELADAAWAAARDGGRAIGEDLWLHSNRAGNTPGAPIPCLVPVEGDEVQGELLGKFLAQRLADPSCEPGRHLVGCDLIESEVVG